jgi:hypothetical protein
MSQKKVGLLLLLALVVAVGTVYQNFRFDRSTARERASASGVDRDLAALAETLANFRTAQAAYVAVGQDPAFWTARASDLDGQLDGGLRTRRAATRASAAQGQYDAAGQALEALKRLDQRAQAMVTANDRFSASDLVFVDSLDAGNKFLAALASARDFERSDADARLTRLARLDLGMNAFALGLLLVTGYAFARNIPATDATTITTPAPLQDDAFDSGIVSRARSADATSRTEPARSDALGVGAGQAPDLSAAAELCVDLARVIDSRDVPGLVERAAAVLRAKGVVLWVANDTGARLDAAIAFGYSDKVIARMGPLQVDSDNVTSLAFRTLKPQALDGAAPASPGALAVPLITASGCVGVLSAELGPGTASAAGVPMARIIAAQLSALVAPDTGPAGTVGALGN